MSSIKKFGKKLYDKYAELWIEHPFIMTILETTIPTVIGYVAGYMTSPEKVTIYKHNTVPIPYCGAMEIGEPKILKILTDEAAKRASANTYGFYGWSAGVFKSMFSMMFRGPRNREIEKQEADNPE